MPLPPGVVIITVTGTYNDVANKPSKGFVKFEPTIHTAGGGATQVPSPVIGTLRDGTFTVQLPTEVDAMLAPSGWVYKVSERIQGGEYRDYAIALAESPTSVLLADLTPVESESQVSPYITRLENAKVITQPSAATTWQMDHNLGFYPSVSIEDGAGDVCLANVRHLSINTVQIVFTTPISGRAMFS